MYVFSSEDIVKISRSKILKFLKIRPEYRETEGEGELEPQLSVIF